MAWAGFEGAVPGAEGEDRPRFSQPNAKRVKMDRRPTSTRRAPSGAPEQRPGTANVADPRSGPGEGGADQEGDLGRRGPSAARCAVGGSFQRGEEAQP